MPGDRSSRWRYAATLLLTLAAGIAAPVGPAGALDSAETPPVWAFDPAEPGPDRPPVGRSLFDRLFAAERDGAAVIDVPYPFATLRQRLLGHLGPGAEDSQVLAQVLIPLGRALQRNAAAPDYFASPRLVLAVVGDPTPQQEDGPPPGLSGLGARLKGDVGPILELSARQIGIHVAAEFTTVEVLLLNDDPQRVAGSHRLNQLLAELNSIGGLPVRLRLVEPPFNRFRQVRRHLRSLDHRHVQMIFQMKRDIGR